MLSVAKRAGTLEYKPEFDGIRAIAVMAVLISHFYLGPTLEPFVKRLPLGHMGVQLFFVLSGFLITNILIGCRDNIIDNGGAKSVVLKAFYMRRILRIFPIYYITIFVVFFFGATEFREVVPYHLFFMSNFPVAIYAEPLASGGMVHAQSGHFWSLAVEEQFYLFWPLAVLSLPRLTLVRVCLFLIVAAPIFRAFLFVIGFPVQVGYLPAFMDALGIGAFLACHRNNWCPKLSPRSVALIFKFSICLAAISLGWYVFGILYRPFWIVFPFFESILYLYLFATILDGKIPYVSAVLRNSVLVTVGKVSYGIYLLHTFVADFVKLYVVDVSMYSALLQAVISIVASVLVGLLSWQIVERPINNLKAYFPYKTQERF